MTIRGQLSAYRTFNHSLRMLLLATGLLGFTVFGGIYTVLLNLYLLRLGFGPEQIGLVNGAGQLAFAVFGLPASALSRRMSDRDGLLLGVGLAAAGHLLLPAAELLPAGRLAGFAAAYMLGWTGIAVFLVNSQPFMMAATTPQIRGHFYAAHSALWPLSAVAGSLAGGLLPGFIAAFLGMSADRPEPYRYALWAAALLALPAMLAIRGTGGHHSAQARPSVRRREAGLPRAVLVFMALVVALRVAGEGTVRVFFNVYLNDLGTSTAGIGAWVAVGQLVAVGGALLSPALAERWGGKRAMAGGTAGMSVALVVMALLPYPAGAGTGNMMLLALTSLTRPLFSRYQMEVVGKYWRPTMSGASMAATGISWTAAALAGGFIIARFGYSQLFSIGALLTLLGAVVFWRYFGKDAPPAEDAE